MAANTGRDGFQSSAQVDDFRAETAQGSRLVLAGAALFDQGPQGGVAVEGCPAEAGHRGDVGEGDGVATRGHHARAVAAAMVTLAAGLNKAA